jgi:hypothetical protein
VIAAQNGTVILVGHPYGGAVITEAGNGTHLASSKPPIGLNPSLQLNCL